MNKSLASRWLFFRGPARDFAKDAEPADQGAELAMELSMELSMATPSASPGATSSLSRLSAGRAWRRWLSRRSAAS